MKFDNIFWENFLKSSNNFLETTVIKDAISESDISKLNQGVMDVIRNRLNLEDIEEGFRVYLNGKEQNEDYLKNLCKTPPTEDEDIEAYYKRMFNTKFGIIINSGERHSEAIAQIIGNAAAPLISKVGLPPLGIEITIFIGNYGWTPLGIHQDHLGENVIHFHLGPGGKVMYTWEEDEYKILADSKQNNKDITPLLPRAMQFPFSKGDLYYMPWNKFHIGYTGELSVGITLWLNNPFKKKYANRILESFKYNYIKDDKTIIPNHTSILNDYSALNDLIDVFDLSKDILDYNVKDFFKYMYDEFNMTLVSNGYWQNPPLALEKLNGYCPDNEFYDLNNKEVIQPKPFNIMYTIHNNKISVYVRGSKMIMDYHDELVEVIKKLNYNEKIVVNTFLSESTMNFPKEAILYFLSLIYNKRGLIICNDQNL